MMPMSNKATVARIKWDKAWSELSRAETAYRLALSAYDEAWATYRDTAENDGWCPFCIPAVPKDKCPGHTFFAAP